MVVTLINHQLIIIIPRSSAHQNYEDCFEALRKYIYHIIIHFSLCLPSHYVHNVINYTVVVVVAYKALNNVCRFKYLFSYYKSE